MMSIIVAASDNDVIGRANALPWQLSRDLKNFKEVTTGNTVVMGRKTFESIFARLGKPLPNRKNVIVTQQTDFQAPAECVVAHSMEEAMEKSKDENVFIIGGETIYRLALPLADRLHLTRVHAQIDGDVKLPPINFAEWNLVSEELWQQDEKNQYNATYQVYERKR